MHGQQYIKKVMITFVCNNYVIAKFSYWVKDCSVLGCDAMSSGTELPTLENSVASIFKVSIVQEQLKGY